MKRTVVVTGATGFIGTHVVARLHADGHHVVAIVRPDSPRRPPPDVAVRTARLVVSELLPHIQDAHAVVHLAGVTRAGSERDYQAVNVDGTRAVATAASEAGTRMIHVSSQAAAGSGTEATPREESDAPVPLTAYGRSKLAGEAVVRGIPALDWTILRPTAVYGPGDRGFLPLFKLANRGWFPRVSKAGAAYCVVHVEDLVAAIDAALRTPAALRETYFVGASQPETEDSIGQALAEAVARPYRPTTIPRPLLRLLAAGGDVAGRCGVLFPFDGSRLAELTAEGFVCSVEKAARDLGFLADRRLQEGFTSTAAWYRQRGWF